MTEINTSAQSLTPEQLKKAEKKTAKANRRTAFENLEKAITASKDEAVKKAYAEFTSVATKVREVGDTNHAKFVKFVVDKKQVTEEEVFKTFKIGRKEASGYIRKYLRACAPKDRVWVNFTPSDGLYKVIGSGEKAPKEYTGYIPVDEVANLQNPALK